MKRRTFVKLALAVTAFFGTGYRAFANLFHPQRRKTSEFNGPGRYVGYEQRSKEIVCYSESQPDMQNSWKRRDLLSKDGKKLVRWHLKMPDFWSNLSKGSPKFKKEETHPWNVYSEEVTRLIDTPGCPGLEDCIADFDPSERAPLSPEKLALCKNLNLKTGLDPMLTQDQIKMCQQLGWTIDFEPLWRELTQNEIKFMQDTEAVFGWSRYDEP